VQGQAAPHNGLLFSQLNLPRIHQTTSSAIQQIAFLILFTLSNSNQRTS